MEALATLLLLVIILVSGYRTFKTHAQDRPQLVNFIASLILGALTWGWLASLNNNGV